MSLLQICTDACSDLPLAVPTSIVGNPDETAVTLLTRATLAGQALARKKTGGWVNMIRENDFVTSAVPTIAGTGANSGPNGVGVITLATTTPISALTWYAFGSGVPNNSIVQAVTPTTVQINQALSTTGAGTFTFGQSDYALPADFQRPIDNTMWDRSRFWSMRGPQSPQQWQLFKSSVIGKASIQRRFRFRYTNGAQVFSVDPCPTDNGAAFVWEYVSTSWCQSATGTPQQRWAADTDTGILDEYLIMLGLRWRMKYGLGLSYAEELSEYESEARKAMAADGGMAILDLTPNDQLSLIGPWNLPETNFGNVLGS